MNTRFFSLQRLLEKAGFVLRGANRADCIHCPGHSRGTVSFTSEVAFCHRCKWTANIVTLAREAGMLRANSHAARAIQDSTSRRSQFDSELQQFEAWRGNQIRLITERHRSLWRNVAQASKVLITFPECEPAWCTLAEFYHSQACLSAILDWLMFAKASNWLEADSTVVEVYESWRRYAA
jgi:hypothetical protein